MNVRTVALSLIALAALSAGAVACGGGKSSADKTKTAAAGTPGSSTTASATAAANKTAAGTATGTTPGAASGTPGATNQTPGAAATPAAGASPAADVTVHADGTATNAQGTPVPAPTPSGASGTTPAPGTTPPIDPTAVQGANTGPVATSVPGSAPRISIEAPATASGDFSVSIRLDGLAQPYVGFNIYLTFDASIVDATGSSAGSTLANSPDQIFCAKEADKIPGAEGLGCTILGTATSSNNGILATFSFKRVGGGVAVIHMSSYSKSGSTAGTYVIVDSNPDPAISNPTPLDVALSDATVTVS